MELRPPNILANPHNTPCGWASSYFTGKEMDSESDLSQVTGSIQSRAGPWLPVSPSPGLVLFSLSHRFTWPRNHWKRNLRKWIICGTGSDLSLSHCGALFPKATLHQGVVSAPTPSPFSFPVIKCENPQYSKHLLETMLSWGLSFLSF